MATYSVLATDGNVYGPVDDAGLVQWAREGRVAAATNLRLEPGGQVLQAAAVPALRGVLQPAVPAPGGAASMPVPARPVPMAPAGPYVQAAPVDNSWQTAHTLGEFSVGVLILLHFVTFGIFSFIWMGLMSDRLPRLRPDDPSAGKHIGFMFIPFFNLYWVFFAYTRLADRVAEQRQFRGLDPANLRGLAIAMCVAMLIPYVGMFVAFPILCPAFLGLLQSRVNELVRLTRQQSAGGAGQPAAPGAASFGPGL